MGFWFSSCPCGIQVFGDKEANLLLVTLSAAKGLVWDAHGVSIRKRTCCLSPLSAAKGKGLATAAQRSFAALRMTARTPAKSAHGVVLSPNIYLICEDC